MNGSKSNWATVSPPSLLGNNDGSGRPPQHGRGVSESTGAQNNRRDSGDDANGQAAPVDRQAMFLEREWSSLTNIWQGVDASPTAPSNPVEATTSPFLVATEETPFTGSDTIANRRATWRSSNVFDEDAFASAAEGPAAFHSSIANFEYGATEVLPLSRAATYCVPSHEAHPRMEPASAGAGVTSRIHDAARITDWSRVLMLCATDAKSARYKGRDGWTALHHACNRRCPHADVAEALIKAYPGALLDEEEKGWTPLHYACRFKAPKEVVRLLLHLYPETGFKTVSKQDKLGRTPLYYAVRYDAPAGVVELLLEVDPSAGLVEDQNNDSPLALVWDSWADKLEGKRTLHSFIHLAQDESQGAVATLTSRRTEMFHLLKKSSKLSKKWAAANMFLRAAFGFSVNEDEINCKTTDELDEKKDSIQERKWRVLHATVAIKCHPSLFMVARALYPEQAEESDENDLRDPSGSRTNRRALVGSSTHQTALHLAVSSNTVGESGRSIIVSLLRMYRAAAEVADGIDGSLPLHLIVENKHKRHWTFDGINAVYMAYKNAAQISDKLGKLPLHRAAAVFCKQQNESTLTTGFATRSIIINLVEAYPQAARHADNNGCLPLHLVAEHAEIWDEEVEAVVNANVAAVRVRCGQNLHNRLPIHIAAANPKAKASLIRHLVELNPRGLSQADRTGKLPLHLACESNKISWEEDGLQDMYDAFPDAIRIPEQNSRGWTVLHMAAACEKSFSADSADSLLGQLVRLYPEASRTVDKRGRYALHLAAISGTTWLGGLQTLFEANPEAVSIGDNDGLLPFHLAAFRYCSHDSDTTVNEDGEDGNSAKDKSDIESSSSVDVASTSATNGGEDGNAAKIDILYNLLRADPTILSSIIV